MERSFSKIKDVDLKILSELDDRSLFRTCSTNKYAYNLCFDEDFWRNRYRNKFGTEERVPKPEKRTWRNHYLQTIKDLGIFANSQEPKQFIQYIIWNPKGPKYSFFLEILDKRNIPFEKAPEWVRNSFYFLDLGQIKIGKIIYPHITPYQLFSIYTANMPENMNANGLGLYAELKQTLSLYPW
jgi:hypothetical protein